MRLLAAPANGRNFRRLRGAGRWRRVARLLVDAKGDAQAVRHELWRLVRVYVDEYADIDGVNQAQENGRDPIRDQQRAEANSDGWIERVVLGVEPEKASVRAAIVDGAGGGWLCPSITWPLALRPSLPANTTLTHRV